MIMFDRHANPRETNLGGAFATDPLLLFLFRPGVGPWPSDGRQALEEFRGAPEGGEWRVVWGGVVEEPAVVLLLGHDYQDVGPGGLQQVYFDVEGAHRVHLCYTILATVPYGFCLVRR
jgi:hypothetical protein